MIFEANDLSCFKEGEHDAFLKEYNELFNSQESTKALNSERFLSKMQVKHMKLRAMYDSLTTCDALNARAEFKNMFGKDYESIEDLKLIINLAAQLGDKIQGMGVPQQQKEGMSFVEVVQAVELSRNIPIDRQIKLFEFHTMYKTELKKWQT